MRGQTPTAYKYRAPLEGCCRVMLQIFRVPPNRPAGLKTWLAIILTLIISIAALSVVAILAVGAFLIFVPILLIIIAAYAIWPKRKDRQRQQRTAREPEIIDGQYKVVDSTQADRERSGGKK
jgi:membrane protein implicated in regulation of membrane protease activity